MKGGFVMPFSKEALLKDHVGQDDISGFLAEGTEIHGEVRFRDVLRVDGKITGTVHVKEKLEIHPTGRVVGDLTLAKPNLVIHEGGVFEGNIDMNAEKKKDARDAAHKEAEIESIRRHSSTN